MKIHTKTTLLLLSAFLSIIVMFSVFVYWSLDKYSHEDFNRLLGIRLITAAKVQLDGEKSEDVKALRDEFFEKLPHEKDYFFKIEPGKSFEREAAELGLPKDFFEKILQEGRARYNVGEHYFKGIRYSSVQGDYIVLASADNYFEVHHEEYLRRTLILAIFAAFGFSIIISYYFSKFVFRPLNRITERVKQISSENLHLRLDDDYNVKELRQMAETFNFMLDRIETSFETQNNFISNASHELRTPLTSIIGEADVALSKIRKPEEYIDTIKVILDEADKLDRKTKALLFLAQTGFNGKVQKFGKIRMDQLLWDVKETVERINPKNQIQMDMSLLPENPMRLKILGNDQLLHLAFTNIISNACKYSDYKVVNVSVGAANDKVIVVIKDEGIGIPESELKYIYDPFFRASNTKKYEGYGIGLPLSLNIIRMHQGELNVSSIEGHGTVVEVKLPIGKFENK
jgi:signal transduction histidine kinase